MARFDLHRIPGWRIPLVVSVQSDLLSDIESRAVIPLRVPKAGEQVTLPRLNPMIDVDGTPHILETTDIGAQPMNWLGAPVGKIKAHRDTITSAMDFLFQGY